MPLPATGLQAAQSNTGCTCRVYGCQRVCKLQWWRKEKWLLLPIVLRDLWSTKSEAVGQQLLAGRGMWGWLEAALPA